MMQENNLLVVKKWEASENSLNKYHISVPYLCNVIMSTFIALNLSRLTDSKVLES